MSRTIVIYHKSDFDGIFCREIARKFLPDAELIGLEYGETAPEVPDDSQLYILDLSVDTLMMHPNLIWIDHHKSAIDKYENGLNGGERFLTQNQIAGYRIDGVAACRIAWQWFLLHEAWDQREMHPPGGLPIKQDFIDRKVSEPLAVRLAGEYDIWDKRDPRSELFQHGLRSQELTEQTWRMLLDPCCDKALKGTGMELSNSELTCVHLLNQGRAIQYAKTEENKSIIQNNGFTVKWEGLTFLACNASNYNSHLFAAGILPEHEALLGFCRRANGKWTVSLYGVPGKVDIDLSVIATKYGGGGHKQACGFTCDKPPFLDL